MSRLLVVAIAASLAAIAASCSVDRACKIVVTDASGNVYVAGRGDDIRAAWIEAVIPADWRELTTDGC